MKKTINIDIPEGFEAIQEITDGGNILVKFIPIKEKYPISWEEAIKLVNINGFTLKLGSRHCPVIIPNFTLSPLEEPHYGVVQSEKQAKSILAYTQLCTIVSAILGRTEIGKINQQLQYQPSYNFKDQKFEIWTYSVCSYTPFWLDDKEQAEHLIKYFTPLLKDFFMID